MEISQAVKGCQLDLFPSLFSFPAQNHLEQKETRRLKFKQKNVFNYLFLTCANTKIWTLQADHNLDKSSSNRIFKSLLWAEFKRTERLGGEKPSRQLNLSLKSSQIQNTFYELLLAGLTFNNK